MSATGRFASSLLAGVLAIALAVSGLACGSATLKTDGGAGASGQGGAGGTSGRGGTGGRGGASGAGVGGAGGAVGGTPCVLDSTQVDNCVLK
jgi:hypothetical protein